MSLLETSEIDIDDFGVRPALLFGHDQPRASPFTPSSPQPGKLRSRTSLNTAVDQARLGHTGRAISYVTGAIDPEEK